MVGLRRRRRGKSRRVTNLVQQNTNKIPFPKSNNYKQISYLNSNFPAALKYNIGDDEYLTIIDLDCLTNLINH